MKRISCYIFVLIGAISACKQNSKKVLQKVENTDETILTSLAVKATVDPDSLVKSMVISMQSVTLKFATINKLTKREVDSEQRHIDTLKKTLDTSKIFLIIADTLTRLPDDYLAKYLKAQSQNKVTDSAQLYIESFWKDIKITTHAGKINLRGFQRPYNYICVLESDIKPSTKAKFIGGRFAMSAINFNPARNKALIYTTYSCGSLCGSGKDLYFEKKSGKWILVKTVELWVS